MKKLSNKFALVLAIFQIALVSSYAQRHIANEAFGFGERLEYKVGYKFVKAGTAVFSIGDKPVKRNGQDAYDIRFDVKSLESLDWMYKVRDQYRTVVDVAGIYPIEFEQHIREGNYKRDFKATFDQQANLARTTDGEFKIPDYVHDVVSAFYYIRTVDLKSKKKGDVIKLQNFYGKKTYDLGVKVLGREEITVDGGKFRCVIVEPMIQEGGLFKADGRVVIWLSDDERKIPVKVSTKIPIGTIDAELVKFSGLRGELAARLGDKK
ncbi:MAG: DUF3108 domain-containing protein [Bacteroidota bacterium]